MSMLIQYKDEFDSPAREAAIRELLPKQTIICDVLEPLISKTLFKALAKCVRTELEIYRNYPKKPSPDPVEEMLDTFNPTNNETCYMGKGFKSNDGDLVDAELYAYRRAIGTIPHYVWGDVTLLEIWGGDHFEDHKHMVTGAFEYGMKLRDNCPVIKFFVNPLFKNKKSKEFRLSKKQVEEREYMDDLMARAMVYGVKSLKEAQRDRKRR